MLRTEYLSALVRDGVVFGDACEAAGLDTAVSPCPGWTVADLVWHLTEVHQFWRTMVAERLTHWDQCPRPARPADGELLAAYRTGFAATVEVLTAADPATETWTWSSDKTAGFVVRRMAQETAVHRWDAEQAAGRDAPIDAALASDGIDEFLSHFIQNRAEGTAPVGGSVHLHCTDVAGEWTVREVESGFDVAREHSKGDCALRGAANDLLLALWRRRPLSTVDVVGDTQVAARFVASTDLD